MKITFLDGLSDPYYELWHSGKKVYKSEKIKNNIHPVWAEAMFTADSWSELTVKVYDADMISDDLIGEAVIDFPFQSGKLYKLSKKSKYAGNWGVRSFAYDNMVPAVVKSETRDALEASIPDKPVSLNTTMYNKVVMKAAGYL